MDSWLAWKMLVSSIILIKVSESCQTIKDRSFAEVIEPNNRSPWLVMIVDGVKRQFPGISGVCYGSLIKNDLVLTAASKVSSLPDERLKVMLKCESTDAVECDAKSIITVMHSLNFDENQVKPSDWMILILNDPFEIQDSGVIPIAGKNYQWDPQDCLIYDWMFVRVLKDEYTQIYDEGFVHREFRVTLGPGSSRIYPEDEPKLHEYVDCFIDKCNTEYSVTTKQVLKLSFVGSPLVCKLLDQNHYVQIGFTNFVFQRVQKDVENKVDYESYVNYDQDTFVDLTKDFDEFIRPIALEN